MLSLVSIFLIISKGINNTRYYIVLKRCHYRLQLCMLENKPENLGFLASKNPGFKKGG